MTNQSIHATLTALVTVALLLTAATAQAQARYTYSAAGDEVTDTKTGLTWRRCSEDQTWSGGTCTGFAGHYSHEQALARATAQAGAAGWRLPNIKELSSIADKTRSNPAIDTTAFPATPSNLYWSATPNARDAKFVWGVIFNAGFDYFYDRDGHGGHIRLVR